MSKTAGFICALAIAVATSACGQSDAGITTNIKSKFAADDVVQANDINVTTRDKVVTLSGRVETPAAKEQAIMIARQADGVVDVVDQLSVSGATATSGMRDDIERGAENTGDAVARGADRTEDALERGADNSKNILEKGVDATVDGAKKVGSATATGAKKVGTTVRDAVTDDDPDSDNDGK